MLEERPPHYPNDDELSLRDILLRVRAYSLELWHNKWYIVLSAFLVAAVFLFRAYRTVPVYPARLTFMLNEEGGSSFSGLSSILGQFGLGGSSGNSYNLEKILELSRSRRIMESALFERATVNGQEDFFANHFIREYKMQEKDWRNDTAGLNRFWFTAGDCSKFNKQENRALQAVYSKVTGLPVGTPLFSSAFNKESSIMTLNLKTSSEALSIEFLKAIFNRLSQFYIDKSVEKERETYGILRNKVDSIRGLLYGKDQSLAKFQDTNLFNDEFQQPQLPKKRLNRDIQMLSVMYAEAVKNLEVADFALKNKTPFIQSIDVPVAPLLVERPSRSKAVLLGGIIGGLLASVFFGGRKAFREIMQGTPAET